MEKYWPRTAWPTRVGLALAALIEGCRRFLARQAGAGPASPCFLFREDGILTEISDAPVTTLRQYGDQQLARAHGG